VKRLGGLLLRRGIHRAHSCENGPRAKRGLGLR